MKTTLLYLTIFLFSVFNSTGQIQLGQDIDGFTVRDQCGHELALSNSGNILAVSSFFNNANGYDAGMVRVFNWNGTAWAQRGASLLGDSIDDAFGYSVDMNASGMVVAVGVPFAAITNSPAPIGGASYGMVKIFEWNGLAWQDKGTPIFGAAPQLRSGVEISLSPDGNRIAIASLGNRFNIKHQVKVYDWNGINWIQIGNTLEDDVAGDVFGSSMSFSGSSSILAIGVPGNKGSTSSTRVGVCRVFQLVGTNWTQIGPDIAGDSATSLGLGGTVALNDSGNVLAVSVARPVTFSGHVRVFRWDGTNWNQLGLDMNGEAVGDFFGGDLSINAEGNIIAVGAPLNAGNGTDAGHVRIYRWENGMWTQKGTDIDGEGQFGESGTAVALDSLGNRVALGAPENLNAAGTSGHARVYNLGNLVSISDVERESIITSISPNPFDQEFIVSFKQPSATRIVVRSINGAIVYSDSIVAKSQLRVSLEVESGIYFVEIGEGATREVHKIVKL